MAGAAAKSADPRVLGVVVTFRPPDGFHDTLAGYLRELDAVVLVSNDEDPVAIATLDRIVSELGSVSASPGRQGRLSTTFNRENRGLSAAYNQAIHIAEQLGFDFLLLLDQDSVLAPGSARHLVAQFLRLSQHSRVGSLSGTNVESVEVSRFPLGAVDRLTSVLRLGWTRRQGPESSEGATLQPTFQNSGTLLSAEAIQRVGPFNERLFVDAVDYDFSLRLRSQGYRLFSSGSVRIGHQLGAPHSVTFGGQVWRVRTHSPMRAFYIVRDTLRFFRSWFRRYPTEVSFIAARVALKVTGSLVLLPERRDRGAAVLAALQGLDRWPGRSASPASIGSAP